MYPDVVLTQPTEEAQEAFADEDDLDSLRNGPAQPARQEKQPQVLSKSGDIEDQVAQELLELEGTKSPAQRSHTHQKQTPTRFLAVFSDIECCKYLAPRWRKIDKSSRFYRCGSTSGSCQDYLCVSGGGQNDRSGSKSVGAPHCMRKVCLIVPRFVQRLSPVYDTVRAEMSSICQLAEKVFMEHLAASSEPTTVCVHPMTAL